MKAAISKLNQSGLHLDDEAVRTIQAASRPDWNPSEQLVLVTIPDLSQPTTGTRQAAEKLSSTPSSAAQSGLRPHWPTGQFGWASSEPSPLESKSAEVSVFQAPAALPSSSSQAPPLEPLPSAQPPAKAKASLNVQTTKSPVEAIVPPATQPASPGTGGSSVGHAAVVESIVARFDSAASFLIHFCDIDHPRRSAEVCLSVGFELAERMQRRILLLDSSRTDRPLSSLLGVDLAAGFREVVRTDLNWRTLVRPTSHPLVEVLPAGVIKLGSARGPEQELAVRKLVAELSQRYGGICSCADSAYDLETELLGRCSSGAFLTIDFQMTSRGLARAAAQQMQLSGNRLLGCIAAEIPA
jgi:Mrp family chromosome partitioning ATPase